MLSVTVADRPEELLEELVALLSVPPADPFTPEWVSVPSFGMRIWLQERLAGRLGASAPGAGDGVVANVQMPFPGELRWAALRAGAADDPPAPGPADPWEPSRLAWAVLEVLQSPPDGLAHLSGAASLGARALAVADLFDRYDVHRPAMLARWTAGDDVGATGEALPAERSWQPELYRTLVARLGARYPGLRPPSVRLRSVLPAIADARLAPLDRHGRPLPTRLVLFGAATLTAEQLSVLRAVGRRDDRHVHALLLSPSAASSARLAAEHRVAEGDALLPPSVPRSDDPAGAAAHPLLVGWGRRPLETGILLGAAGLEPRALSPSARPGGTALLARVQARLRAGEPPVADGGPDGSVQFHAAPAASRQVEVLRDVLLGLLAEDPTLQESDILVLCPSLERFAPVIGAVWGAPAAPREEPDPATAPALRYRVVDRSTGAANPVLDGLAHLLELLPGRFDAGAVEEFLRLPAVRRRFGLGEEEDALLSRWVERACIRWGLDGPQRERWGVPADRHANSWASGIEQLLVGVALGEPLREPGPQPLAVGAVLPLPMEAGSLVAAGRLAVAVRSLAAVAVELGAPDLRRDVAGWAEALAGAADALLETESTERWQRARLDQVLAGLVADAAEGTEFRLADVRRLLTARLAGPGRAGSPGVGSITVTTPAQMANVPARVVCLLGLDQDALPVGRAGGDDVMALAPQVGDRDLRAEARAELLAAVGAARDTLVVTYSHRDVRTGAPVPRAVVLEELLAAVAATSGTDAAALVTEHPRQGFDPANFTPGPSGRPFSFDPQGLQGAEAVREQGELSGSGLLVTSRLDGGDATVVDLADLRRFHRQPVAHFLMNRLHLSTWAGDDAGAAELPTGLSHLEVMALGDELVRLVLALPDPAAALVLDDGRPVDPTVARLLSAWAARGALPPEPVWAEVLGPVFAEVSLLVEEVRRRGIEELPSGVHPVDLALPGGVRLHGTVTGCADGPAPGPVAVSFVRAKPHRTAHLAVDLLALTLARPEVSWRALGVWRNGESGGTEPTAAVLRVRGEDPVATATTALGTLLEQYRDGLRIHLPLADRTSYAAAMEGRGAASKRWGDPESVQFLSRECAVPAHVAAFGPLTFDDLELLVVDGFTLESEAERLWGTLATAVEGIGASAEVPA
ncbi:MAG: exodeoxyribonuclease V subunit gamma [Microthrixaceae bacterium]